jgi:hypothetical protein
MMYRGRNNMGGQFALYPFNELLSNWSTPYGLPPAGYPQAIWEVMPPPPSAQEIAVAVAALLGLQTAQPVPFPAPVPQPITPVPPVVAAAPAGPSVEDRLARIEAALAALAAK